MRIAALVLLGFLSAAPTAAAQSADALAAYRSGDYARAIQICRPTDPDALAFLARARLAEIVSADRMPNLTALDAVRAEAEAALTVDPGHTEARLHLAIALSLMTRTMTDLEAWSSGYGPRARELGEALVKSDPDLYHAHGFLSVWHIEVMRRGGKMGAVWMDASLKKSREHYAKALKTGARDPGLHWQYARALAALDAKKHEAEIRAAIGSALAGQSASELDAVMIARAQTLKDRLDEEDYRAAEAYAQALL